MRSLITMWKYPRMVAWFLIVTTCYVAMRVLFARAQIIPYFLEFQPYIVIVPLAGAFWGPAGVWGCLAGSLIGDAVIDLWGPMTGFRAAGVFLFALSCQRLWGSFRRDEIVMPELTPAWSRTMRFMAIALPGCFIGAAWPAWGAEWLRLYPFPYFASLLVLNNVAFCALLGPACYRVMAREVVPHFGTWHDVMSHDRPVACLPAWGVLLLLAGSLGAYLAGLFSAGLFYGVWPTHSTVLGIASGTAVVVVVAPFLVMQLVGAFWRTNIEQQTSNIEH